MQEPFHDRHHKIAFDYDEDTVSLVEEPNLATLEVSLSDNSNSSAGNASADFEYYFCEIETDTPWFNYHGPKIKIPKQESPVTICTAATIGTIRSQRLFWVLFDSGLNVSTIKRSAYQKGVITKLLGDAKLMRTLAGCLKTQEVIRMQDLRLPKFDKNRRINQQKVVVFDNDSVKYNIILCTNFLSKTGIKLNYSEKTWNGLIAPSHFVNLEVWIQMNSMPWKTCFTSKSKTSSLVKIGSNASQPRFWMPNMKWQV